jgi:hypothetical protein
MELHLLHDHGWSIAALAREFGLDWRVRHHRPRREQIDLPRRRA